MALYADLDLTPKEISRLKILLSFFWFTCVDFTVFTVVFKCWRQKKGQKGIETGGENEKYRQREGNMQAGETEERMEKILVERKKGREPGEKNISPK